MTGHPDQTDLFGSPVYPVRRAAASVDLARFRSLLSRAMAQAIRESGLDRQTIAIRMAHHLGLDRFSKTTLDTYTAESKTNHDISVVRFAAFVRAVKAPWLWDVIVAQDGLTILEGDEARLAEIARLQQEQRRLSAELKKLRAVPVEPKGWRRPAR